MKKNSQGFTLFEIVMVIAVVGIILTFALPAGVDLYRRQLVETTRDQTREVLNRARNQAILQKNDSAFGVDFSSVTDNVVLFQGTSYSEGSSYNELYDRPSVVSITPFASAVYFAKRTGLPNATGTITVGYGDISKDLTIDDYGNVTKE